MGGEIHVESRLGQGSRFWFELKVPIAQPVAAAASARRVVTGVVTGYEGPRKKVLIVDDIAANRALMRDYLEPLGFELHEAENGLNALAKAEEVRPDLVLMDSVMPVMDGIEATERLRRTPGLETVPLVAISAAAFREDKQRSLAAGASAFIAKPIELAALLEQIGALMKIRWTEARAGDS
jgi:CheY-like chemotaxis protein